MGKSLLVLCVTVVVCAVMCTFIVVSVKTVMVVVVVVLSPDRQHESCEQYATQRLGQGLA